MNARPVARIAVAIALVFGGAACGPDPERSGPSTTPPTMSPTANSSGSTISTISTISKGAEADVPAERNTIDVAWIAGSDSVWNDVDLPAAVVRRLPTTPGWKVEITSQIQIAPIAPNITDQINAAAADGADALVIPLNISWLTWKEPACLDIDPVQSYVRYECILSSLSPEIDAVNAAALTEMMDAVVASGLPSLLYAIPHSTNVLTDPVLGPIIHAAEQRLATFDPNDPDVTFTAGSFTRDLPAFVEGVDYIDMVHPTPVGAERLADWLAPRVSEVARAAQN